MKIIKRVVWTILILLTVFYIIPSGLLQTPYFQKKISREVAQYLEEKIHTEVNIGQIEFSLFNQLILKNIYLIDQSGDTLFEAKRVAAGFEMLPVFKGKWRIHSIQLFTFQFNLSKETDNSPLNIQYIIDAFAKQDSTKKSNPIDLQINKIDFRHGNFAYRVKDALPTPGKLNPKFILVDDISSKIRIHNFSNDQLELEIDRMSFKEQSGFQVKKIAFDLVANKEKTFIPNLTVMLNKSVLQISNISVDYSKLSTSKNPAEDIFAHLLLQKSDIYPDELSAFFPVFSCFEDKISIEGDFSGNPSNFTIQDFYFRYYNHLMFKTNINLKNLTASNPDDIFISGAIDESFFTPRGIERIINNFSTQPFTLPKNIKQLQNLHFYGKVEGDIKNLIASGTLDTGSGSILASVNIGNNETRFIKGQVSSKNLNLETLMNSKDYKDVTFNISLDAKQNTDKKLSGTINADIEKITYKGHDYNNIALNGEFTPTGFQGILNLDGPEGKISNEGFFVLNGINSEFKFKTQASKLMLDKLNLSRDGILSFDIDVNLTGNNPDNLLGTIALRDLYFDSKKGNYHLDSLIVRSEQSGTEKTFTIQSQIIRGEICGIYDFSALIPEIKQTLSLYLPSLFDISPIERNKSFAGKENNFSIDLTLEDMTEISTIFKLPFSFREKTKITGQYNSIYNRFHLEADIPQATIAGSKLQSTQISLDNNFNKTTELNITGISLQKKNTQLNFNIRMNAVDDLVNSTLNWGNASSSYNGKIELAALFSREKEHSPLRTKIDIFRSNMMLNDSIWVLHPSVVLIDSTNIQINHFLIDHLNQYVKLNGSVSHNPNEEILVELNEVDLEYVFKSLNIKALEFGGMASGFIKAKDVFNTRNLSTHLDVKGFSFNNVVFGDLDLTGTWDDDDQGILMKGLVYKNDSTSVKVNGTIYPVKEELSIHFDAENTDASFLRKYLNKVAKNITGAISGHLHLFGNLNDPTLEGDVFAKNCRFGVEYLNTYYTFTDSVKCLPDEIQIKNISLYDEKGKASVANGYVKHNLFDDFRFSANIVFNDFIVFNATRNLNPLFYGTVYGSGTANLSGTEDVVNIDVSMQNTENTQITMDFMEEADIAEYDFIRFAPAKKDSVPTGENKMNPILANTDQGTEIKLNLLLNATPEATIEIVVDPVSNDKISGYGTGSMQIQYGTKTPLKVIGNYTLEKGKYNFSLQKVIYRTFEIQNGSSVAFRGDPYIADLDIHANYTATANLGELDQQLLENHQSTRNNVPVNCILLLSGPLNHPAIAFDLNLPGSTDELNRQVKSYIRTEDMMNRQIIYLLALNRFYTSPEYVREDTQANNDLSLLTTTLFSQISNILSMVTNDKFQVGTKFHQAYEGEQTSTEFELLLSSQLLNNRLIINGNFGYISNPYMGNGGQNNSNRPLIGDFDMEYILTKSGEIRLRAFNRYDYRNYYSPTPQMTYGLGILFRRDFNRFTDLFNKKNQP
jgi:hypothetical protein